jgi:hypothetical protein
MFEARLVQGVLLRKLLDSMKDLVQVWTLCLSRMLHSILITMLSAVSSWKGDTCPVQLGFKRELMGVVMGSLGRTRTSTAAAAASACRPWTPRTCPSSPWR